MSAVVAEPTIASLRLTFEAHLAEAWRDSRNFACPPTCEHVGCIEARAACAARVQAWTAAIEALGDEPEPEPAQECRECGLPLQDYELARGYEHCLECRGFDEDMAPSRIGR